jgi:hypothetical protein
LQHPIISFEPHHFQNERLNASFVRREGIQSMVEFLSGYLAPFNLVESRPTGAAILLIRQVVLDADDVRQLVI